MNEKKITHEEAVRRFHASKQRKADVLAIVEKRLKKNFEKETGLKPDSYFAM